MPAPSIFLAAPNAAQYQRLLDVVVLPVLQQVGATVIRMPNLGSPNIADEIAGAVGGCDAMVAVVIGRNPNVFWELGIAFSLGKPLVLLADSEPDAGLLIHAAQCVLRTDDAAETRERLLAGLKAALDG